MIEPLNGWLIVRLLLLTGASSVLLAGLARGLGIFLSWRDLGLAVLAPALFLLPFASQSRTLHSTDFLSLAQIPGLATTVEADRYELLNDPVLQFLPWEIEIRRQLQRGSLALWSDRLEGGTSVWVNPQAEVLSPIRLASRLFEIEHLFLAGLALKMLVVSLGVMVLSRRLGVSVEVARLAGVLASLGGGIMPWALFPHSATASWAPWLVCGVLACVRDVPAHKESQRWLSATDCRRVLSTSLAAFAVLASGHPEVAVASALFCGFAALGLGRRRIGRLATVRLLVALVLGSALAAPMLLPFAGAVSSSQRAGEMTSETVDLAHAGWSPASWFDGEHVDFIGAALSPVAFGRAYIDDFGGRTNWAEAGAAYAGLVALVGAVVALLSVRRARWLLGYYAFCMLAATGFLPVAWLVSRLPLLELISYNRLLPVASLALMVAAALGWDRALSGSKRPTSWLILLPVSLISLWVGSNGMTIVVWVFLLVVFVMQAPPSTRMAVLVVCGLLDLAPWAWRELPRSAPTTLFPSTPLLVSAAAEVDGVEPLRLVGGGFEGYPSMLSAYGIEDVRPHNPMAPRDQLMVLEIALGFSPTGSYFGEVTELGHPLVDFLNVGAAIVPYDFELPEGFEVIGVADFRRLARNRDVRKRWFVPERAESVAGENLTDWLQDLRSADVVAIDREVDSACCGQGEVSTLDVDPGHIRLKVEAQAGSLVATSLLGPRGWTVRSQGRSLETLTVNGAFLGFLLPDRSDGAGDAPQVVELSYRPPYWAAGVAAAASSFLILVALGWRAGRRPLA